MLINELGINRRPTRQLSDKEVFIHCGLSITSVFIFLNNEINHMFASLKTRIYRKIKILHLAYISRQQTFHLFFSGGNGVYIYRNLLSAWRCYLAVHEVYVYLRNGKLTQKVGCVLRGRLLFRRRYVCRCRRVGTLHLRIHYYFINLSYRNAVFTLTFHTYRKCEHRE